jgi:hypothetical protein
MTPRDRPQALNDQQMLFCRAYARSLNATDAYLEIYGGGVEGKTSAAN